MHAIFESDYKTLFFKMKPSLSRHELKNQTSNNKTYKTKIKCPYGTIPVLRNTKEFNTKAQLLAAKYFNPLSADSPGTHVNIHFSSNIVDRSNNIYSTLQVFMCIGRLLG